MQMIEFTNVDEIVEIVEMRFNNARVDMCETMRESMIDELNEMFANKTNRKTNHRLSFVVLHDIIESNLRAQIATHYANEYQRANDEFVNVVAIVDENTFHNFAIVALNVETKNASIITMICVNDDLSIEFVK